MFEQEPARRNTPLRLPPGISYEAAGQDEAKYTTSNPVVRWLIGRVMKHLKAELESARGTIADVGVGEGWATARVVPSGAQVLGLEYRSDKVARARTRVPALSPVVADAGMLPVPDRGVPTSMCLEVLEHLTDPEVAVAELARITSDRTIVSVPWEPWFRLGNFFRGKNLSRFGNDIEHVNHFNRRSLRDMLQRHFGSVEVKPCFPWLIAVAANDSSAAGRR